MPFGGRERRDSFPEEALVERVGEGADSVEMTLRGEPGLGEISRIDAGSEEPAAIHGLGATQIELRFLQELIGLARALVQFDEGGAATAVQREEVINVHRTGDLDEKRRRQKAPLKATSPLRPKPISQLPGSWIKGYLQILQTLRFLQVFRTINDF